MPFLDFLHAVADRKDLTPDQARKAMLEILSGEVSTALIAAFLVALRMKGETGGELLGFASAMRDRATPIETGLDPSVPLLDTCGTGGDGGGTFNISTVAAFVVAGAGVHVAKHGNRSLASRCGSADVLEELGINIAVAAAGAGRAIREIGIGFLFAPAIHPAMKHAQPARAELKMRTAFNLLGPLANPAHANSQLIGAPSEKAAGVMAEALSGLGVRHAFVVHGSDGLDEITTTGPTSVWEVKNGAVVLSSVHPDDFGLDTAAPDALSGGDRATNARITREILRGAKGPRRDIVLANSAAALVAAGVAPGFLEGVALAARSIDEGRALEKLQALAAFREHAQVR